MNMMSFARIERFILRKNGYVKKVKKGLHRVYICNLCDNGREYVGGGILVHFSRSHKKEYSRIKAESLEVKQ